MYQTFIKGVACQSPMTDTFICVPFVFCPSLYMQLFCCHANFMALYANCVLTILMQIFWINTNANYLPEQLKHL